MTREEARKAAEVMMAYADGKKIEVSLKNDSKPEWYFFNTLNFNWEENEYRIKKEPTYRPFKDEEECWAEMQKHQPFGWIIEGNSNLSQCIVALNSIGPYFSNGRGDDYEHLFKYVVFADGTPFGIKEE